MQNNNSSVLQISQSTTTGTGSLLKATTKSWKKVIGPKYMKVLIGLDQTIWNQIINSIEMYADSTDDMTLVGLFAQNQIESNCKSFNRPKLVVWPELDVRTTRVWKKKIEYWTRIVTEYWTLTRKFLVCRSVMRRLTTMVLEMIQWSNPSRT